MTQGLRTPIAIVTVTLVALVAMVLTGMEPNWLLVGTLGPLAGCVIWLVTDIGNTAGPAEHTVDRYDTGLGKAHLDHRVQSLRMMLMARRHDRHGQYDRHDRLYETLVELADDQLLAVHGIDRPSDPTGARVVLGDRLYQFVTEPDSARSLGSGRYLTRVVDDIDRL